MTAKRFTMIYFETDGNLIFDETKHNGEWYNSAECLQDNEIVELLNELHDEKQSVIDWIDRKIEEIKPYNSELCRATLLELKELLE